GSHENRDAHVLVSGLSGFCTLVGYLSTFFIQTKKLLVLRIVILGHEDRTGWRLRVVKRIRPRPGCEGRSVFVAKASFEELRRLLLTIQLRSKPTIEGIAVVDPFLSCQGGKAFSGNSKPTRFGVLFCAPSRPLCCLVPT